jgi:sulfatase maturation enzyme AslB (radical SAM superfamily)
MSNIERIHNLNEYSDLDSDEDIENDVPPIRYLPNTIHYETTYACPNDCKNCIADKASRVEGMPELTADQFLGVLDEAEDYTADDRIWRVVLEGGEPLLRPDMLYLARGIVDRETEVTLSTTGYDPFGQYPQLLKSVSSLGIPVDGATPEINSRWRGIGPDRLGDGGLEIAINALLAAQKNGRDDLDLKVRTLIHPGNVDHVHLIPEYLKKRGLDIGRIRWILYEQYLRRVIRPDYLVAEKTTYLVPSESISRASVGGRNFRKRIAEVGSEFEDVTIRTIGGMGSVALKYMIVNPYGECREVVHNYASNKRKYPVIEEPIGNIYRDFDDTMRMFANINPDFLRSNSDFANGRP